MKRIRSLLPDLQNLLRLPEQAETDESAAWSEQRHRSLPNTLTPISVPGSLSNFLYVLLGSLLTSCVTHVLCSRNFTR